MKRIDYILIGLLAISSLTACTEQKKSNIIIAPKPVAKVVNKATLKMSDYEQTREADWVGSHYKVVVKRSSDKELPVLQLDENTKYYDNRISVKVLRSDGSEFFSRTFTKKDFTSYIDKHTQDMGALLGIVYVKAEGDYLYFAASVGSPDVTSDEYVPLVLKISRMGSISISKDEKLDTNASAEDEEDEEDDEPVAAKKSDRKAFGRKKVKDDDYDDGYDDDFNDDYDAFDDEYADYDFDDDYDDDYEEDEPVKSKSSFRKDKRKAEEDDYEEDHSIHEKAVKSSPKVTPIRPVKKQGGSGMEVCVIKPTSVEDAREITETLLNNRTVVLNVEGLDVEIAQRIIDFTSGSCFAISGNLQKISNYIFIITPASVDISGDFLSLVDTFQSTRSVQTDF